MTLEHNGDSVEIALPEKIDGEIKISLEWSKDLNAGFMQRLLGGDNVDLDLGCYYELTNGNRTLIDCLQFASDSPAPRTEPSKQGCYDQEPYIWHTGDDRGHDDESAETILINPAGLQHIKCFTAYTYIFDGPASWSAFHAKMSLQIPGTDPAEVEIEGDDSKRRFCAVMHIEVSPDARTLKVTKLCTMHLGHSDCDQAYGWGLRYRSL